MTRVVPRMVYSSQARPNPPGNSIHVWHNFAFGRTRPHRPRITTHAALSDILSKVFGLSSSFQFEACIFSASPGLGRIRLPFFLPVESRYVTIRTRSNLAYIHGTRDTCCAPYYLWLRMQNTTILMEPVRKENAFFFYITLVHMQTDRAVFLSLRCNILG